MPSRKKSKSSKPSESPRFQPQRLQKLLASAGFGSRRQCEELIELGRVEVDGEVVTKLGSTVDPSSSKVRVDGVPLKQQKLTYYAVNKPVGVVTTNRDPHGRPRVVDLVPPSERVFPVGRLDRASEGLILLTNDGDLAQKLTHPKFGVRKVYRVTVAGRVDNETMRKMRKGIYIAEGLVRVDGARILKARPRATDMEIVLREGKNREIRRILARFGHKVQSLRRIAVGPLRLGDTPPGSYRILTRDEIQKLRREADNPTSKHSPTSRVSGGVKGAVKRKPPGKKAVAKAASSRKHATPSKSRNKRASKATDFSYGESQTQGSVIGADSDTSSASKPKRGSKKRVRRKASGNASSGERKPSNKRADKKRTSKRVTKKRTAKKKRSTKRAPVTASRRGAGKTVPAKKVGRKKTQRKRSPGRKRKR